jgi:hypothetical protein
MIRLEGAKDMRAIYVAPETALGRKVLDKEAQGLTVVVAPRPLTGVETWVGDFLHGSIYAAGFLHECERSWTQDDAWVLTVVTRAEADDILRQIEPRFDDLIARYAEIGMDGRKQIEQAHADDFWYVSK